MAAGGDRFRRVSDQRIDWGVDQRTSSDQHGARKGHTPVRMCLGCRQRAVVGDLLRMVALDGHVVVDEHRRLAGRGAWVHDDAGCLARAERRRAFPRALRVSGGLDLAPVRDYFAR